MKKYIFFIWRRIRSARKVFYWDSFN